MAKLPLPDWLTLLAALEYVIQETSESSEGVKGALAAAILNEKVGTKGRCQTFYQHKMRMRLDGFVWDRAEIDWKANTFSIPTDEPYRPARHVFADVEVERESLEGWLSVEAEPKPTPAINLPIEDEQDKPAIKEKRQPGEPKPQTVAGWKEAHDEIERFQKILGSKITPAAKMAAQDSDKSADGLLRARRHYIVHLKAAKRQE